MGISDYTSGHQDGSARMRELVLERMRVASQGTIGNDVLRSTHIETVQDHLIDSLAVRLTTEVLTHHLLSEDVALPVSGHVTVPVVHPGQPFPFGAMTAAAVLTLAVIAGLPALALIALIALWTVWALVDHARHAPQMVNHYMPFSENVTVRCEHFETFPENNYVMPRELGTPVRHQRISVVER